MRIYLAGGITGNLNPFWKNIATILRNGNIPDERKEIGKFINEDLSGRNGSMDLSHFLPDGGGYP